MTTKQFILENWKNTYRDPAQSNAKVRLPKPFTVPSISEGFKNFFYWDTYFTNVGLLLAGESEQAKNNLENIAYLIHTHGFMPNADVLLDRSQPPLFARGVFDYYRQTGDQSVPALFLSAIERELTFWKTRRTNECGLSVYAFEDRGQAEGFFYTINPRLNLTVTDKEQAVYEGKNLFAIAESGWDFTHRFATEYSLVDATRFAPVDLNCILYEAEKICGELYLVLKNEEKAKEYFTAAKRRKSLIETHMLRTDGTFGDYRMDTGIISSFTSCASFLPFVTGVSTDKKAFLKTLEKLEFPYGISAGEKMENGFQWDYPNMWAPLVYFAVTAAENCGEIDAAKRIANKYLSTVDRVFEQTGQLWEKYDVETGIVPERSEYGTPPMMGWTASVYLHLQRYKL